MAKGYWVVAIDVTDQDAYQEYTKVVRPFLERCKAKFITRGGTHEVREGQFRERVVVIEFESYQHALESYDSAEYQAMISLRAKASAGDLVIVEGL